MGELLLHGGLVATQIDGGQLLEDGAIRISAEGRIAALGPSAEVASDEIRADFPGEVVDLGGRLVLPGQINAHNHLYSALARGMAPLGERPATDFVGVLETLWWPLDRALDEESVYLSALFGLMESARAGVTTVVDHHASQGFVRGSLDAVARAARDLGLRLSTCFEVTDRDGAEVAAAGLEENAAFAASLKDASPLGGAPQITATLGLHASFTLEDETLARAGRLVDELGLPGVHVHLSEDRADAEDALRRGGVRPTQRLDAHGLLRPGSLTIHGLWVDEAEIALLAERGCLLVTNPSSNMNNGVGRCDLARLRAGGVRVAVGTDGMSGDVLNSLALAYFARRDAARDPSVGWDDALALLAGNRAVAEVFFPGAQLGTLRTGGPADLVVMDYLPFTPLNAGNLLGHVLYGGLASRTRDVICGGRYVLREGRFPQLGEDFAELSRRTQLAAQSLWDRRALKPNT
ncbi:MAG: amidohydrolase family protein [Planctomycetes bacterium]|nr:amidohydrolase family protein [Planctomycetota bacterium]